MPVKVTALNLYPIKSCAPTALSTARLGTTGIVHDRRWMLIDDMGVAITQREQARLCQVKPTVSDGDAGIEMTVSAPGMREIKIKESNGNGWEETTSEAETELEVVLHGHTLLAQEISRAASRWFSDFLNTRARLVKMAPEFVRQVDQSYAPRATDQTAFADDFPLLLVSQESLNELNNRLEKPLPMNRFRPNIVIQGCEPFEEDSWKTVRIADVTFDVVKPCARCTITTTDQVTGERGVEPLRTLATFRKREGGVMFGQNLIHRGQGAIKISDAVEILERVE